jgi:hypothetical protein
MGEGRFQHLRDVLVGASKKGKGVTQSLLEHGFVELPPAGFLPVEPASAVGVEDQVRRMMGQGIDLRFLTARPDVVAQAFAESQHLARISLLWGLDNPAALEPVDVFVPDAVMQSDVVTSGPLSFDSRVSILPLSPHGVVPTPTGFALGGETKAASAAMAGVTTVKLGSSVSLSFAGAAPLPRNVGVAFAALAGLARREGDAAGGEEARRLLQDFQIRRAAEEDHDPLAAANRLSLNGLAANARRFMGGVPEDAQARLGEFAPAVAPGDTRHLVGWLALDIQADLRTVETGDRVPLQINVVYVSPARSNVVVDFSLQDGLEVTQAGVIAANQRRVVGRLKRATLIHTSVLMGQPRRTERINFDAELVITLEVDGTRLTSFTVEAAIEQRPGPVGAEAEGRNVVSPVRFRFAMQLAGEPVHVDARLSRMGGAPSRMLAMAVASTELPLAAAKLAEDPEVQKPSNPLNQTARRALDVLAAGLADPGFVDRSAKRLFPPVQTTVTSHLRATRDWVMFQHRADRIAATTAPAPTTLPARSFQIYEATLSEQDTPAVLIEALRANDANTLKRLGVRPVDRVEFSGGTADLQTSAVQVLDAWRAAGPGDTIVCGAVALHGQSEGNLEKVRLGRIAEVVSVASSLDPTAAFALLPDVPAALDVPNVDGVMVFGTIAKQVARTCVDVRLVSIRDLRAAGELNPQSVRQLLTVAKELGSVVFEGTAVTDGLDRVADRWHDAGATTAEIAIAISRRDDPLAGTEGEIRARTTTIVNAVGGGANVNVIGLDEAVADECPVLLILTGREPEPVVAGAVHELWAILGGSSLWREELEPRLQEGVMNPQVLRNLDRQGIGRALGFREFARGSTDLAPDGSGSMVLLRNLPAPFSDAPVIRRIAIFESESLNDEVDAIKSQAEFLFDETRSPGDVEVTRSPVRPLANRNVLDLLIINAEPG